MNNPYVAMLKVVRKEGAAWNPTDLELGEVTTSAPLAILVGGATLKQDIYCLASVGTLTKGDVIVVKRLGKMNLILGKVLAANEG